MMHHGLLAAFVTPALAAVGAGAMAVPIIIHLLARRRFKRIRWAAMEFLIDAERRNRRRIRMEEWILLALRCLAVLLLGFLVARPFVSPGALAWGGSRRTERILVIDDSFSMGYATADDTSFARSKAAVRRLIDSFRQETPDDAVTLLRATNPATPIALGSYLDPQQADDLLARVEALTPSQRSMDLGAVFKAVADHLTREDSTVDATLYVISDFQRRDWGTSEGSASARADLTITQPLRSWIDRKRTLRVYLVNVGDEQAVNAAVTGLEIKGGRPVAGTGAMVRAGLAHFGPNTAGPVPVQVEVGQQPQEPKSIERLTPYQEAFVEIESAFLRAGDEAIRVELPQDGLDVDNVRYASVDVVSAIRVLVVNGEPSADEYEDEVSLLRTALRPEGEIFSGHEVTVIDEAALESTNLSTFHVVIFANVYRVTEPAIASLERFARIGGGVMFFLGDQVDVTAYNDMLYRNGDGILPAALGEISRPAEPVHLIIADRLHPALGALGGGDDPLGLAQIPFFEFTRVDISLGSEEQKGPAQPAKNAEDRSKIIARFDDADQSAAMIEQAFGAGRVMLITTTADKEWNLWADHPTYLPVLTEVLRHLTASNVTRADFAVGAPIELDVEPGAFDSTVAVRTPGYPAEPEATTTIITDADSQRPQIRWEQTPSAGIYQFSLRRLDGTETVRFAAVNVDATESNLTMADDQSVRQLMEGLPHLYVKGLDQLGGVTSEAKTELWVPVLIVAASVLMLEQFLGFWWGRRR